MIRFRHTSRIFCVMTLALLLAGCEMGYYFQAASGQWELSRRSEPVAEVLDDPEAPELLKQRLLLAQQALDFASLELGLSAGDSYSRYADIERPYVVWNVFAAPELSLEPVSWCFPIAGCVNYRGYFSESAAREYAADLSAQGNDVYVGGVTAYSTLGRLRDPLLNTMMVLDDAEFVGLLFHELAHRRVYVADDTAFNEGFASAVEAIGVQRWLARKGTPEQQEQWLARKNLRAQALGILATVKADLDIVYQGDADFAAQHAAKVLVFAEAREVFARQVEDTPELAAYAPWFDSYLNNALLVAVGSYEDTQPLFQAIFVRSNDNLEAFYARVEELAELGSDIRAQRMQELLSSTGPAQ
ncbi:MAG: aminopeptidase [Gammaproteobacteria bacterium]